MKKLFLPIFLMLTTPFVFSQENQEAKEAKEVVIQFLSMMFKNMLTSENIATYVEPLTFKPEMTLEYFFNITTESDDPKEILDTAILKEILQFALEKSNYTIGKVQKIHNFEYSVEVSFQLLPSSSFADRMEEYVSDYLDSLGTEENIAKFQSFTTREEELDFLMTLVMKGIKEFKKLPLKDSDFKKESYTFKVVRVSEKDKLRITFASEEDLYKFYEIFIPN